MSDVTILMPTFNRVEVLRATLEAMVRVRREGLSVEFVVVDNASTDATPRLLRELAERLPLRCLREVRPGKSNALNLALDSGELGDIVVFTDDDVTPDPQWLEAIVAACRRWPEHGVFGGRIDPGWPKGVPVPFWASDRRIRAIAFSAHHPSECEGPYPEVGEPFGPNFWVRKQLLERVRFREDLGPHPTRRTLGDESEFLRQLRRCGHAPVYVPSARVVHRIEVERTTERALYRRAFQSGRGTVHVSGMPEASLQQTSPVGWRARLASNVGVAALQLVGAALEPDERQRFSKLFNTTYTFSKNLEALKWALSLRSTKASPASSQRPVVASNQTLP